jgi:hypothetical protein
MNQHMRGLEDPVQGAPAFSGSKERSIAAPYRIALGAGVLFAVAVALFAGKGDGSTGFEPQLILLIRFMALMKLGLAIGAGLLVAWRLGRSPTPRIAAGYTAGTMLMAGGPALMWHMHYIIFGSALFYAGLVLLVILARGDKAGSQLLPRDNVLSRPRVGARRSTRG